MSTKKQRLDKVASAKFKQYSRSSIQKLIENGQIRVDDVAVSDGKRLIDENAKIILDQREIEVDKKLKINILHEDDDCIVIDKPSGVLTHSKGSFSDEPTVASWLTDKNVSFSTTTNRSGIVHRLDRLTSGVMILAKHDAAQTWLQKQFSTRRVKKYYTAVVSGLLKHPTASLDLPIERNPKQPSRFRVGPNGKNSVTNYQVLKQNIQRGKSYSLLELNPLTGRTHQLRVHMKYLGHPIVGDDFYGGEKADRLYLHATKLEITLFNKSREIFAAKLPNDFMKYFK